MKRKFFIIMITMLLCLTLSSCNKNEKVVLDKEPTTGEINFVNGSVENYADDADYDITISDIKLFLEDKDEHYPLSDEFIERYQQTSGGYIENAKKADLIVDKQLHEPNQKWHFFDSWLYPSIAEGMSWDESAKSRVYTKLQSPELLLWIYEACGVNPAKVKAAKDVAEAGKAAGTHSSTIAKNMRECVPWEDLEENILNYLNNNLDSYEVSVANSEEFAVNGMKASYWERSIVTFSVNINVKGKEIDNVTINGEELNPIDGVLYQFVMPSEDVLIEITLKDKPVDDIPPFEGSSALYNIVYDLGTGKSAKKLEELEDVTNLFSWTGEGNGLIYEVTNAENIYGGGSSGSGDTKWYSNDMMKFGTTSVNGTITFKLATEVNSVKITGYIANTPCKVRVGDAYSSDWTSTSVDNKTTLVSITGENLQVATKDLVAQNTPLTFTINFESTDEITIATTNKKPLFITAIEFFTTNSEE